LGHLKNKQTNLLICIASIQIDHTTKVQLKIMQRKNKRPG